MQYKNIHGCSPVTKINSQWKSSHLWYEIFCCYATSKVHNFFIDCLSRSSGCAYVPRIAYPIRVQVHVQTLQNLSFPLAFGSFSGHFGQTPDCVSVLEPDDWQCQSGVHELVQFGFGTPLTMSLAKNTT